MPEKILIVDDDLDTLKLVGLILQRQGYEIVAANSGGQGLAKAAAERPNLILLDVMMPDMEGYEVAKRIRAHPHGRAMLLLGLAGSPHDSGRSFAHGFDHHLRMPVDLDYVARLIGSASRLDIA